MNTLNNTTSSLGDKLHRVLIAFETRGQTKTFLIGGFVLVVGIVLLLGLFLGFAGGRTTALTSNDATNRTVVLSHLRAIEQQMQTLAETPQSSSQFGRTLTSLNDDIGSLQKALNGLAKGSDVQTVSTEVTDLKSDVDSQFLDLKRTVAHDEDTKNYLDPKLLPFKVVSVDVISQQPFVTLNYDHHVTPLAVGDSLAGWQIASADYDSGTVEFKNSEGNYIKMTVQG